ncbi:MAG TPA: hypothetical protein VMY42_08455 [Thermoguttaceae bacterium]|nr:hypothetical protein [Thermoguttaceae bacterium]
MILAVRLAVASIVAAWLAPLPAGAAEPEKAGPYPAAISLAVPAELGNRRLAEMGLIDRSPDGDTIRTRPLDRPVRYRRGMLTVP